MRRLTGLLAAAALTLPAWALAQSSPTAPAHPTLEASKPKPKAEPPKPAAAPASAAAKKADDKHPTQPVHPVVDPAKKPAAKPEKTG
jgi:hypothetical protein